MKTGKKIAKLLLKSLEKEKDLNKLEETLLIIKAEPVNQIARFNSWNSNEVLSLEWIAENTGKDIEYVKEKYQEAVGRYYNLAYKHPKFKDVYPGVY